MESNTLFSGMRFDVVELKEGNVVRQVVRHPGAVVILPMFDEQTVVLIRNKREAVGGHLIELPAGTLEPNEEPIACAARELIEETGYQAKEITPLFHCYSTPGFCDECLYFFKASQLTFVGQDLDETEEIEPFKMTLDEAKKSIVKGEIIDMKTIAALFFSQA